MGARVHPRERMKNNGVSSRFLREHYETSGDGLYLVKKWHHKQKLGLQVGSASGCKSRRIKVKGVRFPVAEITWVVEHGYPALVEHIDGDIHNDRPGNLRLHPSECGMKRCPKCREAKSLDKFSRDIGNSGGLRSYCKTCMSVLLKESYGIAERRAKIRSADHCRRSRLFEAHGSHNASDHLTMAREVGDCCIFCGSTEDKSVDHVLSISPRYDQGGSNWPQNLIPSCLSCNKSKSDYPLGSFLKRQGFTRQETLAVLDRWMGYALSLDVTEESQLQDFEPVIRGCVTSGLITTDDALTRLADVELARADLRAPESV